MKYLLIIGDGMADYPSPALGGKTAMAFAKTPEMDRLAAKGRCGTFRTLPLGLPKGSAVANLSILGYDPAICFEGRGVLEAASMDLKVTENDLVMRCNLICVEGGKIKNHSAGNISDGDAAEIMSDLKQALGSETVGFFTGVSYRHILMLHGGQFSKEILAVAPHDWVGHDFASLSIKGESPTGEKTAGLLNQLVARSHEILKDHPVNQRRRAQGLDPATHIWPWSPGKKPQMAPFQERFGLNGVVIAAVDLIKGTGKVAGMDAPSIEGATGIYTTNYEAKAAAAVQALETHDFVLVHVEASDEAGHEGDLDRKVKTIEYLDQRLIANILKGIKAREEDVVIGLLPDHFTPIEKRTHTDEPVPFLIYHPQLPPDKVTVFDEDAAKKGVLGELSGKGFIRLFLQEKLDASGLQG